MKRVKYSVFLFLIIFFMALLGCLRETQVKITGIEIEEATLPSSIGVDSFDVSSILMTVFFSDDTSETIPLSPTMFDEIDREKFAIKGTHSFTVRYEGFTTTFIIQLLDETLYTTLHMIYLKGTEEGLIDMTYEDWLESIRGEDGVGIDSIMLSDKGEIIFLLTNGLTINIGALLEFHTVEFIDYDDSLLHSETVIDGDSARGLQPPVREGYDFIGWDTSLIDITEDMTIRALYEPRIVSIEFETKGGTPIATFTAAAFTVLEQPEDPLRSNYHFGGWYADSLFIEAFEFTLMPAENTTVYARWIPKLNLSGLLSWMETSTNHRLYYMLNSSGDTLIEYELKRDRYVYDLDYYDDFEIPGSYDRFTMIIVEEESYAVAYIESNEWICVECAETTLETSESLRSYFGSDMALPSNLRDHWFEREGNWYTLKADYLDEVLSALGYDVEHDTLLLYRIGLFEAGFSIEIEIKVDTVVVEILFQFDQIGLITIDIPTDGFCAGNLWGLEYIVDEGEAMVTGYDGFATALVLPETVGGVPIVGIADEAFKGSGIRRIHISDMVVSLGVSSFEGALELEEVTFGIYSQMLHVGDYAFKDADSLHSIVLPDEILTIGTGAFWGTSALESFILPNALSIVSSYMFYHSGIASIFIHENITEIGSSAFSSSSLQSIEFATNSQLETIRSSAFRFAFPLPHASVVLPQSLTTIEKLAFSGLMGVDVFIPTSVVNVANEAFADNEPSTTIYVAHESRPATWHMFWKTGSGTVIWGYEGYE